MRTSPILDLERYYKTASSIGRQGLPECGRRGQRVNRVRVDMAIAATCLPCALRGSPRDKFLDSPSDWLSRCQKFQCLDFCSAPGQLDNKMGDYDPGSSFVPALYKPAALLPIARHKKALLYSIETYPVTIVVAATGSGKTTQIPQFLLNEGWCSEGKMIAVTQVGESTPPLFTCTR